MPTSQASKTPTFRELDLHPAVLAALEAVGYENPSPIQAQTIPLLLAGRDVIGQAQTGTGKTAAFALPILSRIDPRQGHPQALVLAPTRELAIQVAEAFSRYASQLHGVHALAIYGGQAYGPQLAALRRGAQVIVGTPGRVLDHLRRGTLNLEGLRYLVLDEADEMLKMGFIEDIEEIIKATPEKRQVALFSATMPPPIRRIAQTYLRAPVEVQIASTTATVAKIRQRYWLVAGLHKLDALTRILEAEPFDGMIVFVRTKAETVEVAEKLEVRGFAAAALNGDLEQKARERVIARLKNRQIDIVVATDIAARGLDVERIGHVINYDIPTDPESYVHRIGRTGRAGRAGEAILFVAPRERHLLRVIERVTRQSVTPMELPSASAVNRRRLDAFKQKIIDALARDDLQPYRELVEAVQAEQDVEPAQIAAALARLLQGDKPLLLADAPRAQGTQDAPSARRHEARPASAPAAPVMNPFKAATPSPRFTQADAAAGPARYAPPPRQEAAPEMPQDSRPPRPPRKAAKAEEGFETYRIEVGLAHKVKPGNIVGAIANEAGLDSEYIGRVDIHEDYSLVDLPEGMPKDIFRDLQKVWVCGRQLRISRINADGSFQPPPAAAPRAGKPLHKKTPPGAGKPPHKHKKRF
ncbi:ATP-dependent RNA helicase DeaD [Solimonas aquatica]|uniref:ATP-dependent RNA helicase DeaD n=1 Tax=Solimonas aquatica TaxID=489703 RepID=A0A1H9K368_9GAMM|nr:DEAD/DEAH box helicase [Solimonas aquatica]SEQ93646.1 ATP-dependent RNA helicase DeaD [Solimonas aquatica]